MLIILTIMLVLMSSACATGSEQAQWYHQNYTPLQEGERSWMQEAGHHLLWGGQAPVGLVRSTPVYSPSRSTVYTGEENNTPHLFTFTLFKVEPENYQCNYIPQRERPAWVDNSYYVPGLYTGIGQSARRDTLDAQIESARASAYRDMLQKISVKVDSTMTDQRASSTSRGYEQSVSLVTQTSVRDTVQGVQVRERWLDQKNCVLWVLATAPQKTN